LTLNWSSCFVDDGKFLNKVWKHERKRDSKSKQSTCGSLHENSIYQ
jgi:hypothetical protein